MYNLELTREEYFYIMGLLEQENEGLFKLDCKDEEFKEEKELCNKILNKMEVK